MKKCNINYFILGVILASLIIFIDNDEKNNLAIKINNISDYNVDFIMLDKVPRVFYEGLGEIRFYKEKTLESEGLEQIMGLYYVGIYNRDSSIDVLDLYYENSEETENTFFHEVSHHIWYNFLTEKERKEYKKIFDNTDENDFIRDYAKKNEIEDFAENFAIYLKNQNYYVRCYLLNNSCPIADELYSYRNFDKTRLKFFMEKIIKKYDSERYFIIKEDIEDGY